MVNVGCRPKPPSREVRPTNADYGLVTMGRVGVGLCSTNPYQEYFRNDISALGEEQQENLKADKEYDAVDDLTDCMEIDREK